MPLCRLSGCDQLVFLYADTDRWYRGASFKHPSYNTGISAAPDGLDITDESESPLCGCEPHWVGRDGALGTCADGLLFSPKQARYTLCMRAQRRTVGYITSVMDAFCMASLL